MAFGRATVFLKQQRSEAMEKSEIRDRINQSEQMIEEIRGSF